MEKRALSELNSYLSWNETLETDPKIIEIIVPPYEKHDLGATRDEHALESSLVKPGVFLETLRLIPVDNNQGFELPPAEARRLMSILARELPNEARMEMIRISRDQEAQREVAPLSVRSPTAAGRGSGARPTPRTAVAILTCLHLARVAGIV